MSNWVLVPAVIGVLSLFLFAMWASPDGEHWLNHDDPDDWSGY